ncbi:MAG: TetR/AcrR family transcriptional regulator [Sphingobacteriia bacterium]|nr:TetR/AcrR family transcriptional regulator [Sphingobacteriia bacterium]NCC39086.1 TetR/AcrR family transcriptional regulator [Gammaproteobacteria bacterium]
MAVAQPPRTRSRNARGEILDAAQRVAARDGAAWLTLAAVARETGLTKGGVLYHFRSKTALLHGMLERLIETSEAVFVAARARAADQPNPTLRAMLAVYDHLEQTDAERQMAIVVAAAETPELLDPVRALSRRYQEQVRAEAGDGELGLLLYSILDGLSFQRLMGLPPTDPAQRAALLRRLRVLIDTLEGAQ